MSQFVSIAHSAIPRMVEPFIRFKDNPLMLAQGRRALRKKDVTSVLTVIGLAGTCVLLLGVSIDETSGWAAIRGFLVSIVAVILLVKGPSVVASSMAQDRLNGILEFHRATPTTSATDALGFLLGTPAKEYLSVAALMPFALIATLAAGLSVINLFLMIAVLLLNGLLFQTGAMLSALTATGKKRLSNSVAAICVILPMLSFPLFKAGLVMPAYLSPIPMLLSLLELNPSTELPDFGVNFFGIGLPPFVYGTLVQVTLTCYLFWAVSRRLGAEHAPVFSRKGALSFFAVLNMLVIGGSWGALTKPFDGTENTMAVPAVVGVLSGFYLAGASVIAIALVVSLTPSYIDFLRALRRARRQGFNVPGWDQDGARAWPTLPMFFGMILAGFALLMVAASEYTDVKELLNGMTVVSLTGVFSLLVFGAGVIEYVRLAGRKSARSTMTVLFITCVLPWMLSGLMASFRVPEWTPYVAALSPVYGALGGISSMAASWMSEHPDDIPEATFVLSQVIGVVMGGWFYQQSSPLLAEDSLKAEPRKNA